MIRFLSAVFVLTGLFAPAARAGLIEYVRQPDPSFRWELAKTDELPSGKVYTIKMVSQTWQTIPWAHDLVVFLPKDAKPTETLVLLNTGGSPGGVNSLLGLTLAQRLGAPVAVLFQIPNQPIYGKKEDALIAETFVRFLDGGAKDESWPLLFPMVKSVSKAMDALQAFAKQEWKTEVKDFVVTGASKRGWTAWLTGAAEPRTKAIAPMVIDVLNMPVQMPNQLKAFGRFSEMIRDYEERKLLPMPDSEDARRLWRMVDPYVYRDRLTMPKLIVNGANDPYWTVDALNNYWNDLKGDNHIVIVPNAGHQLQQQFDDNRTDPIRAVTRAVNGIAAFSRYQIANKPMPELKWQHTDADGQLRLRVTASAAPKAARLWVATSDSRDFRKAKWVEQPTEVSGTSVVGRVKPSEKGFLAFYGELDYDADGLPYSLSTQIRVAGAEKK